MEPNSANYTVMIAVFIIWGGIFFYLFTLDRKVKRLEKTVENESKNSGGERPMKAKFIIGTIIIVVFVAWGGYNFLESTVQYVSYDEARNSKRSVQVAGHIDFDHVNYSAEDRELVFDIYEMDPKDKGNPDRLTVTYNGVVPGNFDQATSIVVRGYHENDKFVAEQLLVKCPSKYQGAAVNLEG